MTSAAKAAFLFDLFTARLKAVPLSKTGADFLLQGSRRKIKKL